MSIQALSCALAQRGVSPSEKLLLLVLANYADEHMRSFPSHRTLSENTGLTERTILSLMRALEGRGVLSRQERRRADGSRSTDLITLHLGGEMVSPRGEAIAPGVGKSTACGGEMVSPPTTFEPSTNRQDEPIGAQAPAKQSLGCRLPDNWEPDFEAALAVGLGRDAAMGQADRFRDYWRAVPGAKGRKLDWPATWRNWCRRAAENLPKAKADVHSPDAKRLAREANYSRAFAGAEAAARMRNG